MNGALWAWGLGIFAQLAWATPSIDWFRWWGRRRCLRVPGAHDCLRRRTHDGGDRVGRAGAWGFGAHGRLGLNMTKRTHDHTRPPRATSSTTATQHGYIVNTTARALLEPSLLFGPCQIGISPEYPLIKSLGPVRASITRILVLRYRMYLYTIRNSCHEPICMTLSAT